MSIELTPVEREHHHHPPPYDAPYQVFIAASLLLAVGGGFALGIAAALGGALEADWGTTWLALVQVHGQLQLFGFAGLFIAGMAFRLMPRFSGRPLAYHAFIPAIVPLIGASLILRTAAEVPLPSLRRDVALIASAVALLLGATLIAAIICRTLVHRDSKAGATGYYFSLGALAFFAAALLNLVIVWEMARDGLEIAPLAKQASLVFLAQFGFTLMFICGVGTRAVPVLSGAPRDERVGRITAILLAAGIALVAAALAWIAWRGSSESIARTGNAGYLVVAAALAAVAWQSGALRLSSNRVAAASQTQFWFVRSAMLWLLAAAAMCAWYAVRAWPDGRMPDAFATDAIRHVLAVGVITMMILGIGMLIVPEFAARRLRHPRETALVVAMIVALNVAVVLRAWPAIEGVGWIASTRFWPMSLAGGLAEAVVGIFALMFAQSYLEQWRQRASPEPRDTLA